MSSTTTTDDKQKHLEMMPKLMEKRRRRSTVVILGALLFGIALLPISQVDNISIAGYSTTELRSRTICLAFLALGAFAAVLKLIPVTAGLCLTRGIFGRDINKIGVNFVPEALGIITGTVYLVATTLSQPFFLHGDSDLGQVFFFFFFLYIFLLLIFFYTFFCY